MSAQPETALVTANLETVLLGSLLINPTQIDAPDVRSLEQSDFTAIRNWYWLEGLRDVWAACRGHGGQIDPFILAATMGEQFQECGGYAQLSIMERTCTSSLLAVDSAIALRLSSRPRRCQSLASEIAQAAAQGDNDRVRQATRALQDIDAKDRRGLVDWHGLLAEAEQRHELWQQTPSDVRGWATGIPRLDRDLGGISQGLISIYGATGMGKSTLARQWAIHFARNQASVGLASTEMAPAQVVDNLVGEMCGVPYKRVRSGYVSNDEKEAMYEARRDLADMDIIMLDSPAPTPDELEQFAHRHTREHRCNILIVDSGSNMTVPDGQGQIFNEMRIASKKLKDIAYTYDIPVLSTWQIGRADKNHVVPRLGDAKGASDIEYNSFVVLAIFRPSYYTARCISVPDQFQTAKANDAFIFELKDRGGGMGDDVVPVRFIMGRGFRELSQDEPEHDNGNGREPVAAGWRYGKDGDK